MQWHAVARREMPPAQFVKDHWHDKGDRYREYVSDLLMMEVVPQKTDFQRVIQDCLIRLQTDHQRRQRMQESS